MPDENTTIEGGSQDDSGAGRDATGNDDLETLRQEVESLRARLKEVNQESAGRRHELKERDELIARLESERKEGLTLEQKLKEAEQEAQRYKAYKDTVQELESQISESNKRRIAALPEQWRAAIPENELSAKELASYLDRTEALFKKPVAPDLDAGAGGSTGTKPPELTPQEKRIADRTGISYEKYAQRKQEIEARRRRDG